MSTDGSKKAVVFALGGNAIIAIIKLIASFFTKSSAMLAEAIHSFADCFNQIFLLIGGKRAQKASNEQHPFGYAREQYFWGFLVAIFLFFVGALFSIYEGVHKSMNPEPISHFWWSIGILGTSVIIELKSFSVALKEFRKDYKGGFMQGIRQCVDTNIIVILLEDAAALLGLLLALLCTVLATFVHPIFDAFGSILIGLLLVYVSFTLTNELRKLIIGEAMPREARTEIKEIIHKFHAVKHINKLHTMAIGKKYLVLISLDFEDATGGYDIENCIEDIKVKITDKIKHIEEIWIEAKDNNRNTRF